MRTWNKIETNNPWSEYVSGPYKITGYSAREWFLTYDIGQEKSASLSHFTTLKAAKLAAESHAAQGDDAIMAWVWRQRKWQGRFEA
jgi:hypothetical protein